MDPESQEEIKQEALEEFKQEEPLIEPKQELMEEFKEDKLMAIQNRQIAEELKIKKNFVDLKDELQTLPGLIGATMEVLKNTPVTEDPEMNKTTQEIAAIMGQTLSKVMDHFGHFKSLSFFAKRVQDTAKQHEKAIDKIGQSTKDVEAYIPVLNKELENHSKNIEEMKEQFIVSVKDQSAAIEEYTVKLSKYISSANITNGYQDIQEAMVKIKMLQKELEEIQKQKFKELDPFYKQKANLSGEQEKLCNEQVTLEILQKSTKISLDENEKKIQTVQNTIQSETELSKEKIKSLSNQLLSGKQNFEARKKQEMQDVTNLYASNEKSLNNTINKNMDNLENSQSSSVTTTTRHHGGWWWWWWGGSYSTTTTTNNKKDEYSRNINECNAQLEQNNKNKMTALKSMENHYKTMFESESQQTQALVMESENSSNMVKERLQSYLSQLEDSKKSLTQELQTKTGLIGQCKERLKAIEKEMKELEKKIDEIETLHNDKINQHKKKMGKEMENLENMENELQKQLKARGCTSIGHAISFAMSLEGFVFNFASHKQKLILIRELAINFCEYLESSKLKIKSTTDAVTFTQISYEDFSPQKVMEFCKKQYKGNTKLLEQIEQKNIFGQFLIDAVSNDDDLENGQFWKLIELDTLSKMTFQHYFKGFLGGEQVKAQKKLLKINLAILAKGMTMKDSDKTEKMLEKAAPQKKIKC